MKKALLLLTLLPSLFSFGQWSFVGTESFTPEGCSSMKIAKFSWGGLVVCTDPYDGVSSRYVHPYRYNIGTMEWDTLYGVINHPVFSTYDLWPDIEPNTTNEWFIYTFAGPNKSYLYQSNIGTQSWDLVDSVDVDHWDLETGLGGDVWMSGYQNIYDHHFGTGTHTTYTFPTLMSWNPIAINNSDEPISFHSAGANAFEVNHLSGGTYTELDSINYGVTITDYDIEISDNQPVTAHLDQNTNQISVKKYNGSTWDQIYVDPGNTYNNGEIGFNMGIDASTGNIVLAASSYVTVTMPTISSTNTIKVYEIQSDLSSYTDLGVATSFTYDGGGIIGIFDIEVDQQNAYLGYVNYGDSSKASVMTYDLSIVSVEESETADFKMFPNPTNGLVNIITSIDSYTVEIYDLSGKLIFSDIGSNNFNMNLSDIEKGVYLVHFKDQERILKTEKLLLH